MPALMLLRSEDNPVPDSPGKWLQGEIVAITPQDTVYGWNEFPQNFQGSFTVAQVNNVDPSTVPLYATVSMTDAGTITNGGFAPAFDVVAGDAIAKMFNGGWYNYGQKAQAANRFFHIRVEDRTPEEVSQYLESWTKVLEYSVEQYNPVTDNRRFTTTNIRVSASGQNGFTAQGIADAVTEWNNNHPANTVVINDTDNLTYFQCDGIMPPELFEEWQANSEQVALGDLYKRRRWYVNQAGINALAVNFGTISNTAANISAYLQDGLLE